MLRVQELSKLKNRCHEVLSRKKSTVDDILSGVVTRDNWNVWWMTHSTFAPSNSTSIYEKGVSKSLMEVIEFRAEQSFSVISESEFLLQNFFILNKDVQIKVQEFFTHDNLTCNIEAFVRLCIQIKKRDDALDSKGNSNCCLMKYTESMLNNISDDFQSSLTKYCTFYRYDTLELTQSVVLMLAILHGPERVGKILEQWTNGSSPGSVIEFVSVVETIVKDWENLCDYPFEWIINMVQNPNVD